MAEFVDVQFRPTLIIAVGKAGALVREYLSPYYGKVERPFTEEVSPYHLLSNLDGVLQNSVGLLQVFTEEPDDDPSIAISFPVVEAFPNDPDIPVGEGPLEQLIYRALISVQLDRRILAIRSANYAVPNPRTQIFIVGEPTGKNKPRMREILNIVRKMVRGYHFETSVCYFLNSYSSTDDYSISLKKPLSDPDPTKLKWPNYEVANFGYLYEHMISYPAPTFVNQDEVRYVTAEALFALIASGIPSSSTFEAEMQIPLNLEDYSYHIGNISTSMILFPRAVARRYTSARLISDLMQKWYADLDKGNLPDEQRETIRGQALAFANNIEDWFADSVERPGVEAEESLWPSFNILRRKHHPESEQLGNRQRADYWQLVDFTGRLFDTFSSDEITAEYKQRRDKSETWASIAYERCNRAVGLYQTWEQHARSTWTALNDRVNTEVRHQVDTRWPESKNGFEIAKVFVDVLDNQLMDIADHVSRWQRDHRAAYKAEQERFLKLAEGTWAVEEDKSNIQGMGQQLGGQAAPIIAGGDVHNQPGGGGLVGARPGLQQLPLPSQEAQIALDLTARANWKHRQIPSAATLCSVALMGWIATAFTTSMFSLPFVLTAAVNIVSLALFVGSNATFQWWRKRESNVAQEDIVRFYQRYYIWRCEYREDLERMGIMRTLRRRVSRIRRRIDDMYTFLNDERHRANNEASHVCYQLFNGPAGARDVFIANGEVLEEEGVHTLANVASKVENERQNHPQEDWHRNLDTMRDELIRQLRQANESLIEMTQERVEEFLYRFTAGVVDGYLAGSLVEISAALDKPEIWRRVFERVRRPLYFADVGLRDPRLMFICGSPKDLKSCDRYIPGDTIRVRTRSSEWLLVVAFFRGGAPTAFDAENLFPIKIPPGGV